MAALLLHDTSLTPPQPGWHRHLEGWQLAVVAVGLALGTAVLVVPRPVVPREIPLPGVSRTEEREQAARDHDRVRRAQGAPLPYLVRSVGEALRRFGAAEARGSKDLDLLRRDIASHAVRARKEHKDEPLLALRAAQTALFAEAVDVWVRSGEPGPELLELGGGFVRRATANGWAKRGSLELDPSELRSLYGIRWTRLAGLIDVHPFAPTLNEWRLYFRAVLRHPDVDADGRPGGAEARLASVSALARIDADYPAALAKGILEYQRGNSAGAAVLLREHLATHSKGPWRLRAQNYLAEAIRGIPPEPEPEEEP